LYALLRSAASDGVPIVYCLTQRRVRSEKKKSGSYCFVVVVVVDVVFFFFFSVEIIRNLNVDRIRLVFVKFVVSTNLYK